MKNYHNTTRKGGKKKSKRKVPLRYLPKRLSKKDKVKQRREINKSRKAYKKGKYYTRKKVASFKSKTSDAPNLSMSVLLEF